jgi:hypothetical protein
VFSVSFLIPAVSPLSAVLTERWVLDVERSAFA